MKKFLVILGLVALAGCEDKKQQEPDPKPAQGETETRAGIISNL